MRAQASEPLLAVEDLSVTFRTRGGDVRALDRVSFAVAPRERVAIVGESGSGKSVTASAILRILDRNATVTGRAAFAGRDLLAIPERDMAGVRGAEIAMVFQNPRAALNPIRAVGRQIADILTRHRAAGDAWGRAVALLREVGIPDPERRARAYPFELSGGMCQRVVIAMALACRPRLLLADEPTTGLDVTTQATVLDLVTGLAAENGMATVLITHDLALAAQYCDRIVGMHAGHVVEDAPAATLFAHPRHPYTAKLVAATPAGAARLDDLASVPGALPDLRGSLPPCRYRPRCERGDGACDAPLPVRLTGPEHRVACWRPL